jgi:predicted transcriptional regulator
MNDKVFNERQRQLLYQFSELRNALLDDEFKCPIGTDLIIAVVQGRPYTNVTIESLMQRTGLERDQLMMRVECLVNEGVCECEDEVVIITDKGNAVIVEVANKVLKVFSQIAERIRSEG